MNTIVKVKKDLTGLKFGKLTVIEQAEDYIRKKGRHDVRWKCICDCGNITSVSTQNLKNGSVKSCGCWRKENTAQYSKVVQHRKNIYEFKDNYAICFTEDKNFMWLFDIEDYDKISSYYWTSSSTKRGYAEAKDKNTRHTIQMSRLVMGVGYGDRVQVDHINHNIFDNRKQNLRICTISQNNHNVGLRSTNTSGVTGVSWSKKSNKWCVHIQYDGKDHSLGFYNSFDEAVKVRKDAEQKYFGEYSYDNSMMKAGEINANIF